MQLAVLVHQVLNRPLSNPMQLQQMGVQILFCLEHFATESTHLAILGGHLQMNIHDVLFQVACVAVLFPAQWTHGFWLTVGCCCRYSCCCGRVVCCSGRGSGHRWPGRLVRPCDAPPRLWQTKASSLSSALPSPSQSSNFVFGIFFFFFFVFYIYLLIFYCILDMCIFMQFVF